MGGSSSKEKAEEAPKEDPSKTKAQPVKLARPTDGAVGGKVLPEKSILETAARTEKFKETHYDHKKKSAIIVAAIDFGTTYSGYAYSFVDKQEEILTNFWNGNQLKTPTVVLMTPSKRFHSFGQEARTKYEQLMKDKTTHKEWYLFERFKMKLFTRTMPLNKDMDIEDILGKKMKAIDIFAEAIRYMREHLLNVLNDPTRSDHVKIHRDTDIRWILTVPAIWDDVSKKFMRDAAEKAGIPGDMLYLALEPEAASLFCKKELGITRVPTGHRYIVLDLGGGTADITCHEVNEDGSLKELQPPTGGDFGGTYVDNAFLQMLIRVLGADVLTTFKTDFMQEYWELMADFEIKKRNFDGSGRVVLKFPVTVLDLYEAAVEEPIYETLQQSELADDIEFKQGKLFVKKERMKAIFSGTVSEIIKTTQDLLTRVDGIDNIILVGGFSESPYLQSEMKKNFDNIIVLPQDPSAAVLKGAVIYGHNPRGISTRKCRYTYGIARMEKFVEGKHPENKKYMMGTFTFCDDIFCKHIEIGTEVNVDAQDSAKEIKYYPPDGDLRQAVLEIYKSPYKNPTFVTDPGCELVGLINIEINPQGDVWSQLLVKLIFGGTELHVQVRDMKNKHTMKATFDFHG